VNIRATIIFQLEASFPASILPFTFVMPYLVADFVFSTTSTLGPQKTL